MLKKFKLTLLVLSSVSLFPIGSFAKNLHLIDQNPQSGYAIYRMGEPNSKDMKEMCALGIQEIMVLAGNAKDHEYKYAKDCPTLKVIYNVKQKVGTPVTAEFLESFDQWVQESQLQGKKIAFRCNCGCHRTGRLAAYYQIKYQGLTSAEAIDIMNDLGKWMFFHPSLDNQVRAMEQYVYNSPCTEGKYCVRSEQQPSEKKLATTK